MAAGLPGGTAVRVGILGCGALGGVMAARLVGEEGVEVEVYNTNPEILRAVERDGLVLVEKGRRTVRPVHLLEAPEARPATNPPLDVVILAAKSVGLAEAARGMLPALAEDGVLVTTQNGLVALDLAESLGARRIVAGAVLWGAGAVRGGAPMPPPGVYRVTAHGPFVIGNPLAALSPGEAGERSAAEGRSDVEGRSDAQEPGANTLSRAAAVLGRIFPVRRSENMPGVLWSKLAITASLTTLGAITGLRFGELVRRRETRRVLLGIGTEVASAARSRGVYLEPLGGGLDMERLLSPEGYPGMIRHLLIRVVGTKHRNTESSMLDSLRRGRRTEIGFLNGRVVEECEKAGVPCPLNRAAVALVRELEAGTVRPNIDHVGRFAVG
jgi:2-dehydropantoate 2-reductase